MDMTSFLKFVAQIIYEATFVLPVWAFRHSLWKKKR